MFTFSDMYWIYEQFLKPYQYYNKPHRQDGENIHPASSNAILHANIGEHIEMKRRDILPSRRLAQPEGGREMRGGQEVQLKPRPG